MKASAKHVTSWLKARWFAFDVLFRYTGSSVATKPAFHAHCLAFLLFLGTMSVAVTAQSVPRTVHVFVALADNKNQGIVPVAARLGNGEDPANNLYWGSAYGVKTFFARSADWQLLVAGHGPK